MTNVFLKAVAGIVIAVILSLSLAKHGKDTATVLILGVCAMVVLAAMEYLKPIVQFFDKLQSMGKLNEQMLSVLIKVTGIGILSEIAGTICTDSGNAALGKSLQIMATAVILWLSIPVMSELLSLIEKILGAV